MCILMYVRIIWDPVIYNYALTVRYGSISWPEGGQERPQHVVTIILRLITNTLLVFLTANINNLFTL